MQLDDAAEVSSEEAYQPCNGVANKADVPEGRYGISVLKARWVLFCMRPWMHLCSSSSPPQAPGSVVDEAAMSDLTRLETERDGTQSVVAMSVTSRFSTTVAYASTADLLHSVAKLDDKDDVVLEMIRERLEPLDENNRVELVNDKDGSATRSMILWWSCTKSYS